MIVVFETPAAAHGDEPRIPDLGEDHDVASRAVVSTKGKVDQMHGRRKIEREVV
jgi:hypothetical protein